MGLRALPLRTMGECRWTLGLGRGTGCRTARLRPRPGCVYWRWRRRFRRQYRVVSARSARSLCAVLPRQSCLCESGEHQQYDRQYDHGHQCVQHDDRRQNHHHQRDLHEPKRSRCRGGGPATLVRKCGAGGSSCRCSEPAANRRRASECEGRSSPHAGERAGNEGCERRSCVCSAGGNQEPAGGCQDGATPSASTLCKTATSSGGTSRTTVSETRIAGVASDRSSGASHGQTGASGQTGNSGHGPSRHPPCEPAGRRQARTTCS